VGRERIWGRGGDDGWGPQGGVAAAANCRARTTREGSGGGGTAGPPSRPKKEGGGVCRGRAARLAGPQGEEGGGERKKRFPFFNLFSR
jgi:hypothetical protein